MKKNHMLRARWLAAGIGLWLGASSLASAADLLEVYRLALAQDPTYAAARAAYQAGLEKLPQGRAGLLPSVGASATFNRNKVDNERLGFGTAHLDYNSRQVGITATQPLFRMQNWAQYEQGKLAAQLAEVQFRAAEQDLILRVAQSYMDVLAAQDNLSTARAQKEAIAQQLALARKSFEVGTATITDTHEAQARYDLVLAQEIAAQSELEIKRHALALLAGKPVEVQPLGQRVTLKQPDPLDIQAWLQRGESGSLLLEAQRLLGEIANQEVSRNRAAHLPTVDLVATVGRAYQGASLTGVGATDTRTNVIGVQVQIPLYAGGAISSKVREAVANQEKAHSETEGARRNVELQVRQAYLGVSSGVAQVKAYEQALVSQESTLESTRLGQEVGVRTNLDVLNAQQQLFGTRRDLLRARYSYLMSQLRLEAAVGQLAEDDLVTVASSSSSQGVKVAGAAAVPVAPRDAAKAPSPSATAVSESAIQQRLDSWLAAWQTGNLAAYLEHYASGYHPVGQSRVVWERRQQARLAQRGAAPASLDQVQISRRGARMVARLAMPNPSGAGKPMLHRTLEFQVENGVWVIVRDRLR